MEYLDVYDESMNKIGKERRDIVHKSGLWHCTVHCWLFDMQGNVYFQIRDEENKLYTTASGHVSAGESVQEGFAREIEEELGVKIDYEKAILTDIIKFKLDRENLDGSIFKDRAFAHVYVYEFVLDDHIFNFDPKELKGIVRVNAKDVLELFKKGNGMVRGQKIICGNNTNIIEEIDAPFSYFLVNKGETAIDKYGNVLRKIIELTD